MFLKKKTSLAIYKIPDKTVSISQPTSFKFMGNFNLWPFVTIFINWKKIAKVKSSGPLDTTGHSFWWRNVRKLTIKIKVRESKPGLAWPSSCCWWWSDSMVLEREVYCDLVQWNHQSSIVNVSRLIQGCHNHIRITSELLWWSVVLPGVATPPVTQHTGAKVQLYCLPFSKQCSGAPNKFLKLRTKLRPSSSWRAARARPWSSSSAGK